MPTPNPSSNCEDSSSWYRKKSKYDCDYMAKKPEKCSKKGEGKVKGDAACPVACGTCDASAPVPSPTGGVEGPREDSSSWYWKKSKYDCDYMAKKPEKCSKKGEGKVASRDRGEDSSSWYWKKSKYDCDYMAKKPEKCSKKGEGKVKGDAACPVACGICSTEHRRVPRQLSW
ncbi:hypothetical protein SO694_00041275 [Aureococcus anophagefferens]|uniref:ShKT domain-containing protein n=1 Tax=Aureococcus anophagefferens TaxID=44056 RepID=A0ABR1G792_AURAN